MAAWIEAESGARADAKLRRANPAGEAGVLARAPAISLQPDIVVLVHAFDVLGDPVRRRILEVLDDGEQPAGEVGAVIQREFGISQPAVSRQLRVLRENGFASVRTAGTRRLYAVDPEPLQSVDRWLAPFRKFWSQRLDALGTELARGNRARRDQEPHPSHRESDLP